MLIMSAKLSRKAKVKTKLTRTEGRNQNFCQGQSIDSETALQNIIYPRVRTNSHRVEKVCRYPKETLGCKIKNLLQQMMTQMYGACSVDSDQPDLIVTTQVIYDAYETALQANKRWTGDASLGDAGFQSLGFKGASVVVDSHCPAGQQSIPIFGIA